MARTTTHCESSAGLSLDREYMEVAAEVSIDASCKTVWGILTDVDSYPQWNPFIRELHGRLATGAQIQFRFALIAGITLPARARVLAMAPERELRWAGHLCWDVLLRAEHFHQLDAISEHAVRLRQGERFSGALAYLLAPLIRLWAPRQYRNASLALKQRAERMNTRQD